MGAILDAAIRLYRAHWKVLMAIVAVLLVPSSFLVAATTATGSIAGTAGATVFQYVVITPLLAAAVVKASADVYLGAAPTVGGTYRFVWTKIGRLVGLVLLLLLGVAVAGGGAVFAIVTIGENSVIAAIVLALAVVAGGIFLMIRLYFAATTIVLEDQRTVASIRRTWQLTRGHFWKAFGTLLLAFILAAIVNTIISTPFAVPYFFDLLSGGDGSGLAVLFIQTLGSTVAAVVTQPFTSLVGVLLYFDLRIRDEGFDLEVMARELRGA